jgi:hypothetical protein
MKTDPTASQLCLALPHRYGSLLNTRPIAIDGTFDTSHASTGPVASLSPHRSATGTVTSNGTHKDGVDVLDVISEMSVFYQLKRTS